MQAWMLVVRIFKEPPDEPVILSVEISASKPGLQLQPDYLLDLERKKHNI
jgi:hypothetical protein